MPQPLPEEQVRFLLNVQRLLSEGTFTASYKFAMLLAIADLAVEMGGRFRRAAETSNRCHGGEVHWLLLAPGGPICQYRNLQWRGAAAKHGSASRNCSVH